MNRPTCDLANEDASVVSPPAKPSEEARMRLVLNSSLHAALFQAVEYARRLVRAELAAGHLSGQANSALSTVVTGSVSDEAGGWFQTEEMLQQWFESLESLGDQQPGRRDIPVGITEDSNLNRRCTAVSCVEDVPPPFATLSSKILLHGGSGLPGHLTILLGRSDPAPPFDSAETDLLTNVMWKDIARAIELAYLRSESLKAVEADLRLSPSPVGRMTRKQLLARLSQTEREVLVHLLRRKTEPEVAHQLGRSPHTVHVHVKNIYRKLSVTSRSRLLQLFELAPSAGRESRLA